MSSNGRRHRTPARVPPTTNKIDPPRGRKGTVAPSQTRKKARTPSPNNRIDASSLPRIIGPNSPINQVSEYQSSGKFNSRKPPSARSNYRILDDGCAGPRFCRLTYNLIPRTVKAGGETSVSLGAIIQPLASLGPEEGEVPLVDLEHIPRCDQCFGYVNAYCTFHNSGRQWKCSICSNLNDVHPSYLCGTDGKGHRLDQHDRPELQYGSVDYIAPRSQTAPKEPNFLFILDSSLASHNSGFLASMIDGIFAGVDSAFPEGETMEKAKIGFITYDKVVQVITSEGIYIMNDVQNPFLPIPPHHILAEVGSEQFDNLLQNLDDNLLPPDTSPSRRDPTLIDSCFGAALQLASEVLAECGGRIVANVIHLPTLGVGSLKNRDDQKLYGTPKEKELLRSTTSFYRNIADRCVEQSISVDMFFGAAKYCDMATLTEVSHLSGGSLFHYPNFNSNRDSEQFIDDITKVMTRFYGLDAYAAIRCSPGVVLSECYGGFSLSPHNEFRFAQVNSDTTFVVTFDHEDDIQVNPFVIQFAMLYTPRNDQPLIRIHTICRKTSTVMADIFRQTDLETVMAISAKLTVQTILNPHSEFSVRKTQEQLVSGCVNVLWSYRKHCAQKSKRGQLILPETLKLMPLLTLGFLKTPGLHPTISIDERVTLLRFLSICPISTTLNVLYPALYNVSNPPEGACEYTQTGYFCYPIWKPLTIKSLRSKGIFLMHTGRRLYLCVGRDLEDDLFDALFTDERGEIGLRPLENNPDYILEGIHALIEEIRFHSPVSLGLQILFKPDKNGAVSIDEKQFLSFLIDDVPLEVTVLDAKDRKKLRKSNPFKMDYTDFLVHQHNEVRKKMSQY